MVGLTATRDRLVFKPLWGRQRVIDRSGVAAVFMESVSGDLVLGLDVGVGENRSLRFASWNVQRLRADLAALGWPCEEGVRPRMYW